MPKTVRARSASDGVDSAMELWEVVFLSISCLMVCAFSMSTLAVLGIRTHDEHAWRETLFVVGSSLRSVFLQLQVIYHILLKNIAFHILIPMLLLALQCQSFTEYIYGCVTHRCMDKYSAERC
jgi:hypothetical protein